MADKLQDAAKRRISMTEKMQARDFVRALGDLAGGEAVPGKQWDIDRAAADAHLEQRQGAKRESALRKALEQQVTEMEAKHGRNFDLWPVEVKAKFEKDQEGLWSMLAKPEEEQQWIDKWDAEQIAEDEAAEAAMAKRPAPAEGIKRLAAPPRQPSVAREAPPEPLRQPQAPRPVANAAKRRMTEMFRNPVTGEPIQQDVSWSMRTYNPLTGKPLDED